MLQANTLEMEKRAGELATHARQLYQIGEELETLLQDVEQQGGEDILLPDLKKNCEELCREVHQLEQLENRLYEICQSMERCEKRIVEEYLHERLHYRHTSSVFIQVLPDSIRNNLMMTGIIGIKF